MELTPEMRAKLTGMCTSLEQRAREVESPTDIHLPAGEQGKCNARAAGIRDAAYLIKLEFNLEKTT